MKKVLRQLVHELVVNRTTLPRRKRVLGRAVRSRAWAWRGAAQLVAAWVAVVAGCSQGPPSPKTPTPTPVAAKLRLAVVDDPALARSIGRLQGQSGDETNITYEIVELSSSDWPPKPTDAPAASPPADAIIAPAWLLGPAADAGAIVPLPEQALGERNAQWRGVFEALRDQEAAWAGRAAAVPFGSPVLVCYYRADLLEVVHRRPPRTWEEYRELAELLGDRAHLGSAAPPPDRPWCGAMEPLGPGWAGLVLLARAAPYVKHRGQYSTWFDIETMESLVAGPPVVRALEELAAAARCGPGDATTLDPAAVRRAFWQGRCGMAISWPSAAAGQPAESAPATADGSARGDDSAGHSASLAAPGPPVRAGFVALPGSAEVFDLARREWVHRQRDEPTRVTLLSISGRLGMVSKASSQPEAALALLMWLSGHRHGAEVSASSEQTTLFRREHVRRPEAWVEPPVGPDGAARYAELVEEALRGELFVFAPRIPGRAEYLAALDEAVHKTLDGRLPPIEALREAADRWNEITERLGRQRQRAALLKSLGLE